MTVNTQEFYRELEQLTELGYLERPQLDRIRDEYLKTRKERQNIFLIFALLGVVFIGAGVISLFAWNWGMFSRELKAVIALIPLLAVQGCLWWKLRTGAAETWIQSLTLALGLAFLSALGLIYQAYQLSFSLQSMLLTGFVLMLPVVYLLDGYYLAVLYLAGICWTGWGGDYTLMVLFLLPYYQARIKRGANCGLLGLCFFIWFLYLAVWYVPDNAYYACLLILLIYTTVESPALCRRLAGRLLYGLLFLKAAFYLTANELPELFGYSGGYRYFVHFPWLPLTALFLAAAVRMYLSVRKTDRDGQTGLLLFCGISGLLVFDLMFLDPVYRYPYEILSGLCFIAYSLYRLLCGVRQVNLPSVRRYTGALILYIVFKVFLGGHGLLVKGIVFVIAGLAFLGTNYWMTVKLKGGDSREKTSE